MRLLLSGLLCLAPGTLAAYYICEGHLDSISAEDVFSLDHKTLLSLESRIEGIFDTSLGRKPQEFVLDSFDIHAKESALPTAVFKVYFSYDLNREQILQKLSTTPTGRLFYLREIDDLPPRHSHFLENDAVTQCSNGGILMPNSTCACPAFYSGSMCENIVCLHQGNSEKGKCYCPPGVYAMNCEPRACLPAVQNTLDVSKRTFMLVLNTKTTMAYVLNYLITNIGSTLGNTNYYNFILTTYVSGTNYNYMKSNYFASVADLESYLLGAVYVSDGVDTQPTNRALLQTQTFTEKMKPLSNVFAFTDSLDNEAQGNNYVLSDNTTENNLILKTISWRNKIVYLLSQPKNIPLTVGDAYASYRRVAQSTLGDIISYDVTEVSKFLNTFFAYYQNVEVTDAIYSSTENSTYTLRSDDTNTPVNILVTVEPNGILPSLSANMLNVVASGSRFLLISVGSTISPTVGIATNDSPWSLKTFQNSQSTALVSYSSDPNVDVGDAFVSSDLDNLVTAANLNVPEQTVSVYWKDITTSAISSSFTFLSTRTQECSFPLISTNSNRCIRGPFIQEVRFNGIGGAKYRLLPGYCVGLDKHSPAPFVCLNGGSSILSGAACNCSAEYIGAHCEVPVCQNGGSVNSFPGNGRGQCNCPTGYSGDLCELLRCPFEAGTSFDNTKRSFGMVIQTSMSQAQWSSSIKIGLNSMLGMLTGNDSFKQYVLSTVNAPVQNGQNKSVWSSKSYPDSTSFISAVTNVDYLATNAKTLDTFSALTSAMMSTTNDRSSIFLFVDSPPSGTTSVMDIIWYAITHQFEISVVITPPYNMSDLCISTADVFPYLTIVQKTGGVLYNLCAQYTANGMDPIVQFFQEFGTTHHHTENIAETFSPSCRAESKLSFFIDDPTSDTFLIVNSDATQNFTVLYANNDVGGSSNLHPVSSTPFIAVYKLPIYLANQNGYQVRVTDGQGSSYGECYIKIASKTTVAAFIGFSLNPSQDAYTQVLTYASKLVPVVHISTPMDGTVYVDATDDQSSLHYFSSDVKRTNSCSYESYLQDPLICDSLYGTFIVSVKTVIPSGAKIQRSRRSFCYLQQQQCLNGGYYLNGKCLCPAGQYQGPYCEYPMCQNGAELRDFQCICGDKRRGNICQYETCSSFNYMEDTDPREVDYRQITFVVNTNADQLLVLNYVSSWLQNYVDSVDTGLNKLFSLVTFDASNVYNVATTVDKDTFVQIFQTMIVNSSWATATSTKSIDALIEAYKINIDPPSIVYLFTGTTASSLSSTAAQQQILRQKQGTQVNIIYTPQGQANPARPSGSYDTYLNIASKQSGGRIWPLTQNALSQLQAPLTATVSEDALIFDDAQSDCSQGMNFPFILEDPYSTVYFEINGNGVSLDNNVKIYMPNGNMVADSMFSSKFVDSTLLLLSFGFQPNTGGNWSVLVTTETGNCFVQVRTKSSLCLIPGFTSDQNNDFVNELPFSQYGTNKSAYIVFRTVESSANTNDMSLDRVEIWSGDYDRPWSGRALLQTLNIRMRDTLGCAYQFVSDLWNMNNTSSFQKFVLYGTNSNGNQFQRTFFYMMRALTNKTTTCQNGARNANGECICSSHFTGDTCIDRLCENGGSQSYGLCVCPNGYFGDYCYNFVSNSSASSSTSSGTTQMVTSKITTVATTAIPSAQSTMGVTTSFPITSAATVTQKTTTAMSITTSKGVPTTTPQITSSQPSSSSSSETTSSTTKTTATMPTTTSSSTTTTSTTFKSTGTTKVVCDPYTTRYMLSLFLDNTNFLFDDASGTYYTREYPIIKSLATKLDLGTGIGGSRFLFNGVGTNYTYCGNATDSTTLNSMSSCLGNGRDLVYDLTKALFWYSMDSNPNGNPGVGESPPIGIIFSATDILNGTSAAQPYIMKLQRKNYKFLGVDVSYDGSKTAQLVQLVGVNNVYTVDTFENTAQWLRNKVCVLKPY